MPTASAEGSYTRIAGVDEAGRGPLAGPVVAAAVILDPAAVPEGIADSKRLSPARRARLAEAIQNSALAWAVVAVEAEEIDRRNILQASLLAMHRAVDALRPAPQFVQVDGNRCPDWSWPSQAVVGGDALVPAIGAASILAKEHRDATMRRLDAEYPGYGFARHKGYPTRAHLGALQRLGPCAIHRRSFAPVRMSLMQQSLDLAP